MGEHSRTWHRRPLSASSRQGRSWSRLLFWLLEVKGRVNVRCRHQEPNYKHKDATHSDKSWAFLTLHLTRVGCPVAPATHNRLFVEMSYPDWVIDALQRQIWRPRPRASVCRRYTNIFLRELRKVMSRVAASADIFIAESVKQLLYSMMQTYRAAHHMDWRSFSTYTVNDAVVFSAADLDLANVSVVYRPAHDEALPATEIRRNADVRAWRLPNCTTHHTFGFRRMYTNTNGQIILEWNSPVIKQNPLWSELIANNPTRVFSNILKPVTCVILWESKSLPSGTWLHWENAW